MTKPKKIAQLRALTDMVLEAKLAELRVKAEARQTTADKIEGLRAPAPVMGESLGVADALAALNFQIWAEARRAELSQILARQTAEWLDSRDQARLAFGKAQGFEKLTEKLRDQRRPPI